MRHQETTAIRPSRPPPAPPPPSPPPPPRLILYLNAPARAHILPRAAGKQPAATIRRARPVPAHEHVVRSLTRSSPHTRPARRESVNCLPRPTASPSAPRHEGSLIDPIGCDSKWRDGIANCLPAVRWLEGRPMRLRSVRPSTLQIDQVNESRIVVAHVHIRKL